MRRVAIPAVFLFLAALLETSLLSRLVAPGLRPGVVLIISSVWAALRGDEGLVWAFGGGLMLDMLSAGPFGLHTAGLLLGNFVAQLMDRLPIPSRLFRATNWVAIATAVSQLVLMAGLLLTGMRLDPGYAVLSIILPLLLINPLAGTLVYAVLSIVSDALDRRTRGVVR